MDASKISRAVDANQLTRALFLTEWAQIPSPHGFKIVLPDHSINTSAAALAAKRLQANSIPDSNVLTVLECSVFHFIEAKERLNAMLNEAEEEGLRCVGRFYSKPTVYQVKSWQDMRETTFDAQRDELMNVTKASRQMRNFTRFMERELRDSEVAVDAVKDQEKEWTSRMSVKFCDDGYTAREMKRATLDDNRRQ